MQSDSSLLTLPILGATDYVFNSPKLQIRTCKFCVFWQIVVIPNCSNLIPREKKLKKVLMFLIFIWMQTKLSTYTLQGSEFHSDDRFSSLEVPWTSNLRNRFRFPWDFQRLNAFFGYSRRKTQMFVLCYFTLAVA